MVVVVVVVCKLIITSNLTAVKVVLGYIEVRLGFCQYVLGCYYHSAPTMSERFPNINSKLLYLTELIIVTSICKL